MRLFAGRRCCSYLASREGICQVFARSPGFLQNVLQTLGILKAKIYTLASQRVDGVRSVPRKYNAPSRVVFGVLLSDGKAGAVFNVGDMRQFCREALLYFCRQRFVAQAFKAGNFVRCVVPHQ